MVPATIRRIGAVDVVTASHAVAAPKVRLLAGKARIIPVLGEGQCFLYAHCVDQKPASAHDLPVAAGPDDPVTERSVLPYVGLAGCERAKTVERVGGKPAVIGHDVTVKDRHADLFNRRDGGGSLAAAPVCRQDLRILRSRR